MRWVATREGRLGAERNALGRGMTDGGEDRTMERGADSLRRDLIQCFRVLKGERSRVRAGGRAVVVAVAAGRVRAVFATKLSRLGRS